MAVYHIGLSNKAFPHRICFTFTVVNLQNFSELDDFDDTAFGGELDYGGGHQAANQPHGGGGHEYAV